MTKKITIALAVLLAVAAFGWFVGRPLWGRHRCGQIRESKLQNLRDNNVDLEDPRNQYLLNIVDHENIFCEQFYGLR
ncbi:MAG: hypothetical protein COU69_00255 [Candidatus Pacebacteria bacterium CG10_big_fil_rev_8_21_14_0_10_56_10]|nr:MAG: hypothetical protein COU69_00255 [Candidatus Pacebacteria bacterium CG10_big_fil_rev_8_21_14_0_10_56_10]